MTAVKVCEPVQCGEPPVVPAATPALSGDVTYGMSLQFHCDGGYSLDGTVGGKTHFKVKCGKDGKYADLKANQQCKPVSAGEAPSVANAFLTEYDGKFVESLPVVARYPNGIEYECAEGYSVDGTPNGAWKITSRVNQVGKFAPELPTECKLITYSIKGQVTSARDGKALSGVTVSLEEAEEWGGMGEDFMSGELPSNLELELSQKARKVVKTVIVSGDDEFDDDAD